jgi:hypothetical protein
MGQARLPNLETLNIAGNLFLKVFQPRWTMPMRAARGWGGGLATALSDTIAELDLYQPIPKPCAS